MLNWRRDPDVERRIAESERRIAESRMRAQQLRKETEQLRRENALLDEKLRNFKDLELRLKQAAPISPTASTLSQPSEPSLSKP
jgi:septal ring factor EnvC (AmiA/AmiB activator)